MLELNNLSCGYGPHKILTGVNLKIAQNEIFTFIGPNGSGKTTLLKTILGLLPALDGKINFQEQNPNKISMLESQSEVPFSMAAHELFSIGNFNQKQLEWCIEKFELQDFLNKNLLNLSSGQNRRIWLAHTLIQNAQLILIDEPFSHLDFIWQKKLLEILKEFRNLFSKTFVLVAHELEQVLNLSDRVGLLSENKLLLAAKPEEVFSSQKFFEVFAFTAAMDENPIDKTKRLTLGHTK